MEQITSSTWLRKNPRKTHKNSVLLSIDEWNVALGIVVRGKHIPMAEVSRPVIKGYSIKNIKDDTVFRGTCSVATFGIDLGYIWTKGEIAAGCRLPVAE